MNTLLNVTQRVACLLTPHGKLELQGGERRLPHQLLVQSKTVREQSVRHHVTVITTFFLNSSITITNNIDHLLSFTKTSCYMNFKTDSLVSIHNHTSHHLVAIKQNAGLRYSHIGFTSRIQKLLSHPTIFSGLCI